jgi:fatty acid-binding protein DegV
LADLLFEEFKKRADLNKKITLGITHADAPDQVNKLKELLSTMKYWRCFF